MGKKKAKLIGLLDFIQRVLAEAERADRTPAEKASFLTIVENNLIEFLTVRCPSPKPSIRKRVEKLWEKMDQLAEELIPGSEEAVVEETCPVRFFRDESASVEVGETGLEQAVLDCLQERKTGNIVAVACPEQMPPEALNQWLQEHHAHRPLIRRWKNGLPVSQQVRALEKQLSSQPQIDRYAGKPLFDEIKRQDLLLIHPYESYAPIVRLLEDAALDEAVTHIQMTLYRYEEQGPIVEALCMAAQRGASVMVVLELRARGVEYQNLLMKQQFTEAGVEVVTPTGPRVHAKLMLIRRKEKEQVVSYAHFGTGNYHTGNAKHYTDVSLLTADGALCEDAERFFRAVQQGTMPDCLYLTTSPCEMRSEIIRLIRREMSNAVLKRPCGVWAKMNALTDPRLIDTLTEAGRLGVPVQLIVRGVCLMSDTPNVTIRSLVGAELEHARVFHFLGGGESQVFLSSADWMPRNLDRRHELFVPVQDEAAKKRLIAWLELQCADTSNSWLLENEQYRPLRDSSAEQMDSQKMMRNQGGFPNADL